MPMGLFLPPQSAKVAAAALVALVGLLVTVVWTGAGSTPSFDEVFESKATFSFFSVRSATSSSARQGNSMERGLAALAIHWKAPFCGISIRHERFQFCSQTFDEVFESKATFGSSSVRSSTSSSARQLNCTIRGLAALAINWKANFCGNPTQYERLQFCSQTIGGTIRAKEADSIRPTVYSFKNSLDGNNQESVGVWILRMGKTIYDSSSNPEFRFWTKQGNSSSPTEAHMPMDSKQSARTQAPLGARAFLCFFVRTDTENSSQIFCTHIGPHLPLLQEEERRDADIFLSGGWMCRADATLLRAPRGKLPDIYGMRADHACTHTNLQINFLVLMGGWQEHTKHSADWISLALPLPTGASRNHFASDILPRAVRGRYFPSALSDGSQDAYPSNLQAVWQARAAWKEVCPRMGSLAFPPSTHVHQAHSLQPSERCSCALCMTLDSVLCHYNCICQLITTPPIVALIKVAVIVVSLMTFTAPVSLAIRYRRMVACKSSRLALLVTVLFLLLLAETQASGDRSKRGEQSTSRKVSKPPSRIPSAGSTHAERDLTQAAGAVTTRGNSDDTASEAQLHRTNRAASRDKHSKTPSTSKPPSRTSSTGEHAADDQQEADEHHAANDQKKTNDQNVAESAEQGAGGTLAEAAAVHRRGFLVVLPAARLEAPQAPGPSPPRGDGSQPPASHEPGAQ